MTAARRFAQVAGTLYVSAAVLGVAAAGLRDPWTVTTLWGIEVNGAHSLLHLALGVTLLAGAAAGAEQARSLVLLTAGACGVLALVGPAMAGTEANVLALGGPDHLLHLVTAVVALAAVLRDRPAARRRPRPSGARGSLRS